MPKLEGQVAVVFGASRGIGAAAGEALAAEGAAVLLAARSVEECEAVAARIRESGGRAEAWRCDVTDWASVEGAVGQALKSFGRLDIVVNNAGVIEPIGLMGKVDPGRWAQAATINLVGVFHGLRAALPILAAQGSGVVVNVSSGAAVRPLEGWSHYCASKAGAKMLTECAQHEYGLKGVRVVGLSPGTVATDMQRAIKASGVNAVSRLDWEDHIPPEWAGRAVAWLCTEDAKEFAGVDVSLREDEIRRRAGLI